MTAIEDQIDQYLTYGDEYEGCYPMFKYCPLCGSLMQTKNNKYGGVFRGCSNFPKCSMTESFQEVGEIVDNWREVKHLRK